MKTRAVSFILLALMLVPGASLAAATSVQAHASPIICEVTASKKVIPPGEKVIITWKSSGAMLWYGPSGEKIPPAGSMEVSPTKKTIYKFKMVGIGGNDKCGVRIRMAGDMVPK